MPRIPFRSAPKYTLSLVLLACIMLGFYTVHLVRLENAQHHLHVSSWAMLQSEYVYNIAVAAERAAALEGLPEEGRASNLRAGMARNLDALNALHIAPPEPGLISQHALYQSLAAWFESSLHLTPVPDVATQLEHNINRFNEAVTTFLSAKGTVERLASLDTLRSVSTNHLLPQIIKIREFCRSATVDTLTLTRKIETAALGVLFALLVALGWFVLRPLEGKVRSQQQNITRFVSEIEKSVLKDPTTGLSNINGLTQQFERCAAEPTSVPQFALLARFLSVRPYHQIFDESFSKQLMVAISDRLHERERAGDFIAHLGEGKFFFLHSWDGMAESVQNCLTALERAFEEPLPVGVHRVQVRVATGHHPISSEDTVDDILSACHIALDAALRNTQAPHVAFCEDLRKRSEERATLATELKSGLKLGELRAHFQPQVHLRTGRVLGFEALVRWYHPRRGILSPGVFLALSEELGLDDLLGEVMLDQGLEALRLWDRKGLGISHVGLNFSRAQLQNPKQLEYLKWALERENLTPDRISIEVLENIHVEGEGDQIIKTVRSLADHGFRIDLDDFGTGSASITGLRRFQAHRVKIDRSFIADIDKRSDNQQMVSIMMHMARSLGLDILAEGVETPNEIDTLRKLGCYSIQGYHVAKPMPLEDTEAWMTQHLEKVRSRRGPRSIAV